MTVADWDPFGTIRNALWIGGGQWAGKSTVARPTRPGWPGRRSSWPRRRSLPSKSGSAGPLDDLQALTAGRPVIAEGWGLRPHLVARLIEAPDRMVVMVPTEEFRQHQTRVLPRAMRLGSRVSDPERAEQQRLARDRLVAADAVRTARQCGIEVIEVDGGQDAATVADTVAGHFRPYLPISA
jgi:uncharacterized protein (DUF58 family)